MVKAKCALWILACFVTCRVFRAGTAWLNRNSESRIRVDGVTGGLVKGQRSGLQLCGIGKWLQQKHVSSSRVVCRMKLR
ncbi:hypothetical protein K402DRAFT_398572, partial [Aulographum hederae CBS 113979]